MSTLGRGDLLPRVSVRPPGPRSRSLTARLGQLEAPGVNTFMNGEPGLVWKAARGANVLDVDGNVYIDLTSGFGAALVGHRHPRVVRALRHQAGELLHGLGDVHAHPSRIRLAARLAAVAPVDDPRVYFAVSGSDAVEVALKTAFLATGRSGILCFEGAYHGLSLGALSATSREAFRSPFQAWVPSPVVRLPYGIPAEDMEAACRQGPPVGVALVEPVQGREGVRMPPDGWLRQLSALCRQQGIVLAVDEILTGFGRTGELFAVDREKVRPDLLVCGKALGGGLPVAAVLGRRELMEAWERGGEALHTGTFIGHPLACAAALEALEVVTEDDLPGRARRLGELVETTISPWKKHWSQVCETRGRGLLWAVELSSSRLAHKWCRAASESGVLALAGGEGGRTLQIMPPLTITRRQLLHALELLESTLEVVLAAPLEREVQPP